MSSNLRMRSRIYCLDNLVCRMTFKIKVSILASACVLSILLSATSRGAQSWILTSLKSFNSEPISLIQGADGNLYGIDATGGTNFGGSLFRMTTNGTLTTVASFSFDDFAHAGRNGVYF